MPETPPNQPENNDRTERISERLLELFGSADAILEGPQGEKLVKFLQALKHNPDIHVQIVQLLSDITSDDEFVQIASSINVKAQSRGVTSTQVYDEFYLPPIRGRRIRFVIHPNKILSINTTMETGKFRRISIAMNELMPPKQ